MFVAIATTIGQVIISAMAGYAFARFEFKYKEPLFLLILVSMMIPPQVNIVPLFFIMILSDTSPFSLFSSLSE